VGKVGPGRAWSDGVSSCLVLQTLALQQKGSQEKLRLLIALDTSQKTRTLANYRHALGILVVAGVGCSALLALGVTRQGLAPLRLMTELVQRLSPAAWSFIATTCSPQWKSYNVWEIWSNGCSC